MIPTLLWIILGLCIALYFLALLLEWQSGERALPEVTLQQVSEVTNTIERNVRKGVYLVSRLWRNTREYSSDKARSLFIKLFPSANRALKEHDLMTGLSTGPSSYFLSEITPEKKVLKSRRKRKSVQE